MQSPRKLDSRCRKLGQNAAQRYASPFLSSSVQLLWNRKGSSYPPGRTEVYEPEAGEGAGSVFGFGFGARGPAEGGGAGPRATDRIGAWPPPAISTWSVR